MEEKSKIELEAAAFRALVDHLRQRTDVQNIDMMNLAGFCRNCLSRWYAEAAQERDIDISKDAAREIIYGMPYVEWRDKYQKDATAEQKAAFEASDKHCSGVISRPSRFQQKPANENLRYDPRVKVAANRLQ